MYDFFDLQIEGAIAHLQMSRPSKANAMNDAFWQELPFILNDMSMTGDVRVCILSGKGPNFSAGMDLNFFAQPGLSSLENGRKRAVVADAIKTMQKVFDAIEAARFPVIAAVHGACFGGALDMISACDFRFACKDAMFAIEEINVGMMADLGSLQRLPYLIPEGILRELAYTGDRFDAQKALEYGLVNRVFATHADMLTKVKSIAEKIAAKPPIAINASKNALNYSRNHGLADSLEHAQFLQAAILEPGDVMRAIQTSMTGKPAEFDDLLPQMSFALAPKKPKANKDAANAK